MFVANHSSYRLYLSFVLFLQKSWHSKILRHCRKVKILSWCRFLCKIRERRETTIRRHTEIFGSPVPLNKMFRAARSRWIILWLCKCNIPAAMPFTNVIFCVSFIGCSLKKSNLSKLPADIICNVGNVSLKKSVHCRWSVPPPQYSSTRIGCVPSVDMPNTCTTFGCGGNSLFGTVIRQCNVVSTITSFWFVYG
jgi:hypothetical protein